MTQICHSHLEYLKSTLESEEGYSHPELYAWSDKYIDAENVKSLYGSNVLRYPKCILDLIIDFPWTNRYNSLVQHGAFFENIVKLEQIRWPESDEEKWRIELDLNNIPYEIANFEICYCWMDPGRCFSYDWRILKEDVHLVLPFPSESESNAWDFVYKMFKKISDKHLPICTVEDFLETSI